MRYALILLILSVPFVSAQVRGGQVALVANDIDMQNSQELMHALFENKVEVFNVKPKDLGEISHMDTIILLGGQNSPQGMGEISSALMPDYDKVRLLEKDKIVTLSFKDAYRQDQMVFLFAGHSAKDTQKATDAGRNLVLSHLRSELEKMIDLDLPERIFVQVTKNTYSYSIPITVRNTGGRDAFDIPVSARLEDGSGIETNMEKIDLNSRGSSRFLAKLDLKKIRGNQTLVVTVGSKTGRADLVIERFASGVCNICKDGVSG